ncbi:hypothetical protein J2Z48_003046 [Croceifilum oryzae]|uniref:Uncharacterized protein n=1 Tax=Croceifilum oryzae TaxID=1553429 RepID=A0AAJ1WVB1_9BACL|nr:hypothetical protein [Croceifilum oryzae]MDQ0418841.1 hypothetical protein [Croceifilum oryzae]
MKGSEQVMNGIYEMIAKISENQKNLAQDIRAMVIAAANTGRTEQEARNLLLRKQK